MTVFLETQEKFIHPKYNLSIKKNKNVEPVEIQCAAVKHKYIDKRFHIKMCVRIICVFILCPFTANDAIYTYYGVDSNKI